MNQIQYKLSVLPLFEEDLNGIVDYITEQLNNPTAALNLVDDIESKRLNIWYLAFCSSGSYNGSR